LNRIYLPRRGSRAVSEGRGPASPVEPNQPSRSADARFRLSPSSQALLRQSLQAHRPACNSRHCHLL